LKIDETTVAGAILAIVMLCLLGLIVAQTPFPVFRYASASNRFIDVTQEVGPTDSSFMWTNRTLDLSAQAFVIFAAAVGSLAMLRIEEKEDDKSD
jgi:hypothetical protein